MAGGRRWIRLALAVALAAPALGLGGWRDGADAAAADPTKSGPLTVDSFEYDGGEFLVRYGTSTAYPERLHGSVHHPTSGRGHPLLVLLHGNHQSCRVVFYEVLFYEVLAPCVETPVTREVKSFTGYDWFAENLASHGYIVVSASANGTNGASFISEGAGTEGRVQVLQKTLELAQAWSTKPQPEPVGDVFAGGRVDLARIGLMGHSRGGEAVTRFITHNRIALGERWRLRGVVALAATDFGKHTPAGVPFAALLPTCDGDVYDLQGSHAFERAVDDAPRVQWVVRGANHNFFNTIWTYDDGGGNRSSPCAAGSRLRLTAAGQRQVGLALMGAFLRRHVGGERQFEAAATSRPFVPGGACSETCDDTVRTTYLPARAVMLGLPGEQEGALSIRRCDVTTRPCPSAANRSWTEQAFLRWAQPAELTLHASAVDLRGRSIVLRVATDRDHADNQGLPPSVALRIIDDRGRAATVDIRDPALRHMEEWIRGAESTSSPAFYLEVVQPPKNGPAHVVLSDARVPASAFARVDLKRVQRISLVWGRRGAMYLGGVRIE